MPNQPVLLLGGAYQNRSLIAGAQQCINLYPESNPPEGSPPVPVTHYCTPGLTAVGQGPEVSGFRALYLTGATTHSGGGLPATSTGDLFCVMDTGVYYIDDNFGFTLVGNIAPGTTPVYMRDNGQVVVIVDGSATGYAINMQDHTFGVIGGGYQAADRVDYIDTFFIFNVTGTNQFYISLSNVSFAQLTGGAGFDPLDVAAKTGSSDNIGTLIALQGNLWLIGTQLSTEVWVDSGNALFPFERLPNAIMEHGIAAIYSLAKTDVSAYFLMQDREGRLVFVMTAGYQLQRVSTHAIEQELQKYTRTDDAVGYCRLDEGHAFYVCYFPTADVTWAMELETRQWHVWESLDNNGLPHRQRVAMYASAYGANLGGDYQNGKLYKIDPNVFNEDGNPIRRLRSFPHMVANGLQQKYLSLTANMEVGQINSDDDPQVFLRWSDDRGVTYSNAVGRSFGKRGEYLTAPMWKRLGRARDRVFELSWSSDAKTALNGAWVSARPLKS